MLAYVLFGGMIATTWVQIIKAVLLLGGVTVLTLMVLARFAFHPGNLYAADQFNYRVAEYTPAEIKRAVVGYGRADKPQVQHMIKLLLGLAEVPSPHDAADALAVAICHVHAQVPSRAIGAVQPARSRATSWRTYRPASAPVVLRRGKPAGS